MKNLKALSCTIGLRGGGQSVSKAASLPFVVHNARDVLTVITGIITVGPCRRVSTLCLPDVTAHD